MTDAVTLSTLTPALGRLIAAVNVTGAADDNATWLWATTALPPEDGGRETDGSAAPAASHFLSQPGYVFALVVGCVAIAANSVCLGAILRARQTSASSHHYRIVMSLIAADLLIDVTLLTFIVNSVVNPVTQPGLGDETLRLRSRCAYMVIKAFNTTGLNISLLNLLATAIDHYITILRPFQVHSLLNKARTITMITIIWVIAIITGFSNFLSPIGELSDYYKYRDKFNYCEFIWLSKYQEEFVTFFIALVCLLAMTFIYMHIYCKIRRMDPCSTVPSDMKMVRNKRAVVTTLLILGSFIICWMPTCIFNIVLIIISKGGLAPETIESMIPVLQKVDVYLYDLMLLNTLCDPIIYVVRMREIRSGFWRLFQQCVPEGGKIWLCLQHKLVRSRADSMTCSMTEDRRKSTLSTYVNTNNNTRRNTSNTLKLPNDDIHECEPFTKNSAL